MMLPKRPSLGGCSSAPSKQPRKPKSSWSCRPPPGLRSMSCVTMLQEAADPSAYQVQAERERCEHDRGWRPARTAMAAARQSQHAAQRPCMHHGPGGGPAKTAHLLQDDMTCSSTAAMIAGCCWAHSRHVSLATPACKHGTRLGPPTTCQQGVLAWAVMCAAEPHQEILARWGGAAAQRAGRAATAQAHQCEEQLQHAVTHAGWWGRPGPVGGLD